ncbi:MAG: carbon-nitrogen hydrolase family protein, partial [Cyanobacteriota bacterium]
MSSFLAAALQLTSISDPDANFAAAEEQIELASRRGAELVG